MTFTEIALRMYPYWLMGIFMIFAVYFSEYKNLLRIELKPLLKWVGMLVLITFYRIVIFKIFSGNNTLHNMTSAVMTIPWQATLTVFWEDACHGLPLAIIAIAMGLDKRWKNILMWSMVAVVAASFGLGHVYQGYPAALLLSFYIPFTFKKGREIGFGTVILCHTLYDLVTILTMKTFLG